MKLNFANPATGQQKLFEVEDEKKLRMFYDKRMAQEVEIDALGEEWKVALFLLWFSYFSSFFLLTFSSKFLLILH